LISQICNEALFKYFPMPEKAPLFIKNFVDQNREFFRTDEVINQWLILLESNVCFETDEVQTDTTNNNGNS
jgi:hypothetical protein